MMRMKIRTQMILAFLLLAVLPLTSLVVYSYSTSRRALRDAVEAESDLLALQMEQRMTAIKEDLRHRMEKVGRLPLAPLWRRSARTRWLYGRIVSEIGEAAELVESFTVVPVVPAPPVPPEAPAAGDAPFGVPRVPSTLR